MKARLILALVLPIPAAFAYACGGGDSTSIDGGGLDGNTGTDGTVKNDTGTGSDTGTGNDTGTGSDTGTGTDGGSGGDSSSGFDASGITCKAPSDCTNEFCCGTIVFNGGQIPNCSVGSVSSACKTTCKSNISLNCNATETIRACATNPDCADAGNGYTKCCTVPFADAAATFCWNAFLAGQAGGSCQ